MGRRTQYRNDGPWSTPLIKDRWSDFLVHEKFSNEDDGTGFVEAWVDRKPITFAPCNCTNLSMQTMHSTQPELGFYLTSDRARGFLSSAGLYFDGAPAGTTRASAELQ